MMAKRCRLDINCFWRCLFRQLAKSDGNSFGRDFHRWAIPLVSHRGGWNSLLGAAPDTTAGWLRRQPGFAAVMLGAIFTHYTHNEPSRLPSICCCSLFRWCSPTRAGRVLPKKPDYGEVD